MRFIPPIVPVALLSTCLFAAPSLTAQGPGPVPKPKPTPHQAPRPVVVVPKRRVVVVPVAVPQAPKPQAPRKPRVVKTPIVRAPKSKKPSGRATRRISTGTVSSVNGPAVTLQLAEGGAPVVATLEQKTAYHRLPAHAAKPAPSLGGKLVVRLAYYPDGRTIIDDVWDPEVYAAEQRYRKEVVTGSVTTPLSPGTTSGFLVVKETATGDHITYRVTDKTVFYKAGAPVAASAFTAGSPVAVRPRGLPGGGFMAAVVADSAGTLDQGYRDTLTLWSGSVQAVNAANNTLTLKRTDGAVRTVLVPPAPPITDEKARKQVGEKRTYTLAELTGHTVIVRVMRGERADANGVRHASEITVMDSGGSVVPPPVLVNPTAPATTPPPAPVNSAPANPVPTTKPTKP